MASLTDNHYEVLGVSRDATQKEIRSAYMALARSLHPDKQKFGAHLMKRINEAYEALSDSNTRYTYDRGMSAPAPAAATPSPKTKKGPTSPPRQNQKENSTGRPDAVFLTMAKCVVCNHIVSGTVKESKCCGCLCCESCCPTRYWGNFRCPNKSCKAKLKKDTWRSSKFLATYLEKWAPTHECGQRVPPENLRKHERVCPNLNTECFMCSGRGHYATVARTTVECIGCKGKKILPGKDWMMCFKCHGRGSYGTAVNTTMGCTTCLTKGALKGRWTMCFKCQGQGAYDTPLGIRVGCSACGSAGAFKGFNLTECAYCSGYGPPDCTSCKGKGAVTCKCGSSCKGHSDQFTRRYYRSYDSDSSDDSW